jgi:hypothetical protein
MYSESIKKHHQLIEKIEVFKNIPDYEDLYQVSNLGRVKSLKFGKERILKAGVDGHGYLKVCLNKNGKEKTKKVHQLVAIAFLNHIPNGHVLVVDHINNNRADNRLENLQIISQRENTSKEQRGSSKYTGVSWYKSRNKWMAYININGKLKNLGLFNCEEDAAYAYLLKLREIKCTAKTQ